MNAPEISSLLAAANAAANAAINDGRRNIQREAELNSARIEVVADKLALCAQSSGHPDEARLFFQLCLSLARGIDFGVANNEVPEKASKLPPILKQVSRRKQELFLQAAIMVLMISVKNACKMGWFTAKDTEELLTLANEVGSHFSTMGEVNSEVSVLPTVSSIMSRFYPRYKIGHVIASLEVKPGYGTYFLDFHISKSVPHAPDEKIRLLVAVKDNIDTSSCIVNPQKVNLLLNGRAVERRTNVYMDPGPQFPTVVNHLLKYGTNLLQAVGHFNGNYIILIAFMSIMPASSLSVPQDYVQPDLATLSSESDAEVIEGPSRISLNCPITYKRIRTPVKGHLCKHYQCFDLCNYVELNSKRPSWRCPHCNQSVCFSDLRVDRRMAKVLQEVGETVSEVIISADGSWTTASSNKRKHESDDKVSAEEQEQHECPDSSGADACKIYDLTEEGDEMETVERCEPLDTKPVVHQNQPVPTNLTPSPAPRSTNENQYSSALLANALRYESLLGDSGSASYNIRPEAQIGSGISPFPSGGFGISSVPTDSVSPSFNQQPDNFQGTNYSTSSVALGQFSASNGLHLLEVPYPYSVTSNDFCGSPMIPRNVSRSPSAIQALPVQMPSPHQQHSRPIVSIPSTNRSSVPFQAPLSSNAHVSSPLGSIPSTNRSSVPYQAPLSSNAHVSSTLGSNIDRQRQSLVNPTNALHMAPASAPLSSNAHVSSTLGGNIDRQRQSLVNPTNVSHMAPASAPLSSNTHVSSTLGGNIERQRQSLVNPTNVSHLAPASVQNRLAHRLVGLAPNQSVNVRMTQPQMPQTQSVNVSMPQIPQRLSQPPHLRSSQVPNNHVQHGVSHGGISNSPSTVERIQLMAQHPSAQMRQQTQTTPQTQAVRTAPSLQQNTGTTPPQTQAVRMAPSLQQNTGLTPPQAVSRTENLIDLQSEQNWRPTGRMRGSLTGQAYSAALSQLFGNTVQPAQAPAPAPSPRPAVSAASPLPPHLQALAHRMYPQVSQVINRSASNASTVTGSAGTMPPGPHG